MTEVATIERNRRPGTAVAEINAKLAREVEAAVGEAERGQIEGQPETTQWFYTVPRVGVRYYSF